MCVSIALYATVFNAHALFVAHQIFGIYGTYAPFGGHIASGTYLAAICEVEIAVGSVLADMQECRVYMPI